MPSFQPFSSGGQSSHLHTPETTPLRKRENDCFSSPEAPLLWRQPLQPATGALHGQSTYSPSLTASSSHFAELNFPHTTRRRDRHDNRHGAQFWIPWAMKAILASPLIVLLIWFVAIALHHPTESSTMKNNRYGVTARNPRSLQLQQQQQQNNLLQRAPHDKNHAGKGKIPVYVPMGSTGDQQQQQQFSQDMQMQNTDGLRAPQLMIPYSGAQQNLLMSASQAVQGQNPFLQGQPQMPVQVFQQPGQMLQQPGQILQQAQPQMMMMPGQNMMQLPTQQQPGRFFQQPQLQQGQPQMMQGQPQMMQGQPQMMQGQPQMMQGQPQYMIPEAKAASVATMMAARGNHKQDQAPAHPRHWGNLRGRKPMAKGSKQTATEQGPKIYFYDPAQATVQGQLQAPPVVYDEHGNEVELASLVSPLTDLYIEPPVPDHLSILLPPAYGSTQGNNANRHLIVSSNTTSTSNSTEPLIPFPPPPPLEMKIKRPESWGESTTQDQSIIVCTVATMALLVGALSARRLRSRSFLSSCIENESLEDEVAFDNAYTITGGDSYNTFGWKGDLEKFDV